MTARFRTNLRPAPLGRIGPMLAALVLAALLAAHGPAGAAGGPAPAAAGPVVLEGAWARPGMEGATSAVYFTLIHRGEGVLRLEGAEAPVATTTRIHRTLLEDRARPDGTVQQVMRMEPAGEMLLEPGERLEFRPGGLHVMLMGLKQPLLEGDRVRVTLFLEGLEPLELDVPVLPFTEAGPAGP